MILLWDQEELDLRKPCTNKTITSNLPHILAHNPNSHSTQQMEEGHTISHHPDLMMKDRLHKVPSMEEHPMISTLRSKTHSQVLLLILVAVDSATQAFTTMTFHNSSHIQHNL